MKLRAYGTPTERAAYDADIDAVQRAVNDADELALAARLELVEFRARHRLALSGRDESEGPLARSERLGAEARLSALRADLEALGVTR